MRRVAWGVVPAVLVAMGLWLSAPEYRLAVSEYLTGVPLVNLGARTGMDFSVRFHHSYDRAFFREHYRLGPQGGLVLTHMTFKSTLNGQGFAMGTYRSLPDGWAELADIDQSMERIVFQLGSPDLANHTLILGGRELRLLDYAQPGDLICIEAVAQPRWKRLYGHAAGKNASGGRSGTMAYRSSNDE